ncbi:hypothetical protein [Streptomyces sp. NPDC017988]|uniref:hypothetical protein n=1 Tax=Streptomyces sp. NPDC017988 TaxID=3365025 RepID=UPI0037AEDBD5
MTETTGPPLHTVVHPAALPAPGTGAPGDGRVRVTVHGPAACHTLRLHLTPPAAEAGGGTPAPRVLTPGWHTTAPHPGEPVLEVRRDPGGAPPEPADGSGAYRTEIVLTDVHSGTPGPLRMSVTAETGPAHALGIHTSHHTVQQLPDGVIRLSDFKATPVNPKKNETVTLTWTGPQTKAGYSLMRSDGGASIAIEPVLKGNGKCEYTPTKTVTMAVTAFALTYGDDRALTWATTQLGDIDAGSLSVKGTVRLLHAPVVLLDRASGTQAIAKTTPTDGFVVASLNTKDSTVNATVRAGDLVRALRCTKAGAPAHVQLPAPAGARLEYTTDDSAAYSSLAWFPLGSGKLGPAGQDQP